MAGKGARGRRDRTHIHGTRFDAHISSNRMMADIKDLETGNILTLLNSEDVAEIAVISGDAQTGIPWEQVPTARFRPRGHPDRDGVDILDTENRKRLGGLDRAALEEIQLLAIDLIDMMTVTLREQAWKKWFPEYKVPVEITSLVNAGILKDTTWQHDAAPNFDAILASGEIVTVWVEHPNTDRRISMDMRYAISIAEPGSRESQPVMESNDIDEVMDALHAILRESGGPRSI